jgi:hypothetical protein
MSNTSNNNLVKVEIEGNKIVVNFACTPCGAVEPVPAIYPCFDVNTGNVPRVIDKKIEKNASVCAVDQTTTSGCIPSATNSSVYNPCGKTDLGCVLCKTGSGSLCPTCTVKNVNGVIKCE